MFLPGVYRVGLISSTDVTLWVAGNITWLFNCSKSIKVRRTIMPSWWPRTTLEWAFLSSTLAQALINTIISMTILVVYLDWVNPAVYEVPLSFIVPMTLSVTTLGYIFQAILTLDAYRIKNNTQIFMQCVCNVCLSISTILQYSQVKDANARIMKGYNMFNKPFAKNERNFWQHIAPGLIVCIAVSCACSVSMILLVFGLHRQFSWALYKQVSPDKRIQDRYFVYQVYLVMLKFTTFFLFAFILVYGLVNVHFMEPEFSLTMGIMPVALIHIALAVYFVRHESRVGMAIVLLIHMAAIAYLVSRLMVLYGTGLLSKTNMKEEMTLCCSVALAFTFAALIAGSTCMANFNKGLKPILLGQVVRQPQRDDWQDEYYFQRLNHNVIELPERASRRFDID